MIRHTEAYWECITFGVFASSPTLRYARITAPPRHRSHNRLVAADVITAQGDNYMPTDKGHRLLEQVKGSCTGDISELFDCVFQLLQSPEYVVQLKPAETIVASRDGNRLRASRATYWAVQFMTTLAPYGAR